MKTTAILSISGAELNCNAIAWKLLRAGINCDISKNVTIIDGQLENGCRIMSTISNDKEINKIWDLVKNPPLVKCAHLKINNKFEGCIFDFIPSNKTNCPGLK